MTQETKLEILGPYTPEHEGPWVIDSGNYAETTYVKVNVHSVVDGYAFLTPEDDMIPIIADVSALYNAREIPVAREFWISTNAKGLVIAYDSERLSELNRSDYSRTIHVREVLPGDDQ